MIGQTILLWVMGVFIMYLVMKMVQVTFETQISEWRDRLFCVVAWCHKSSEMIVENYDDNKGLVRLTVGVHLALSMAGIQASMNPWILLYGYIRRNQLNGLYQAYTFMKLTESIDATNIVTNNARLAFRSVLLFTLMRTWLAPFVILYLLRITAKPEKYSNHRTLVLSQAIRHIDTLNEEAVKQ